MMLRGDWLKNKIKSNKLINSDDWSKFADMIIELLSKQRKFKEKSLLDTPGLRLFLGSCFYGYNINKDKFTTKSNINFEIQTYKANKLVCMLGVAGTDLVYKFSFKKEFGEWTCNFGKL